MCMYVRIDVLNECTYFMIVCACVLKSLQPYVGDHETHIRCNVVTVIDSSGHCVKYNLSIIAFVSVSKLALISNNDC